VVPCIFLNLKKNYKEENFKKIFVFNTIRHKIVGSSFQPGTYFCENAVVVLKASVLQGGVLLVQKLHRVFITVREKKRSLKGADYASKKM
jgi:hypothetical protein